jgi:hypothetical protein
LLLFEFGITVEEWFLHLLIHKDIYISSILNFYRTPWEKESNLQGKWHAGAEPNHSSIIYAKKLTEYLDLDTSVDISSSKALLLWRPEENFWGKWYLKPHSDKKPSPYRRGYPLLGKVLNAVFKKLDLQVSGIEEDRKYYMPLDPALPFLLCLRIFATTVHKEPKIIWNSFNNIDNSVVYQVSISCEKTNWGLRNDYWNGSDRGQGVIKVFYETLLHWRITMTCSSNKEREEWVQLFTKGVDYPPYGFYFTPGWVHLSWISSSSTIGKKEK